MQLFALMRYLNNLADNIIAHILQYNDYVIYFCIKYTACVIYVKLYGLGTYPYILYMRIYNIL